MCKHRLYFGVAVESVSVRMAEKFGMGLISVSLLQFLLLNVRLGSGGIVTF